MKKTILLFAALLAMVPAFGQITLSKQEDGLVQAGVIAANWNWMYENKADGTMFFVSKTNNQFDDLLWLKLGQDKQTCIESLRALVKLSETIAKDDVFFLEDQTGSKVTVTKYSVMGEKSLSLSDERHAGIVILNRSVLNKAIDWCLKKMK